MKLSEGDWGGLVCDQCEEPVETEDLYCRSCGSLFSDGLGCSTHPEVPATGVCVGCTRHCCGKCGRQSDGVFLCEEHAMYEHYEGRARVFGTPDVLQANHVASVLEQGGFHPFVFSRTAYPGADRASFLTFPFVYERIVPEQKVLVPFTEILQAQTILHELGFLS